MQISVAELVQAFGRTYKSIDVRSAALKREASWANAVTVVRLSRRDPEAIAQRHKDLKRKFPHLETDHFRILLGALDFASWEDICSNATQGVLHLNGEAIDLRQQPNLNDQKGRLSPSDSDFKPIDDDAWPALRVTLGEYPQELYSTTIERELSAVGYSWPNDAIDDFFEAAEVHRSTFEHTLFLYIPVFASISELRITPGEKKLYVTVLRHRDIVDLKLRTSFSGQWRAKGEVRKGPPIIRPLHGTGEGPDILPETTDFEIPDLELDDRIQAELVHGAVGQIQLKSDWVRRLLPPPQRSILLEALKQFCPGSMLRQLVCSPQSVKAQRPKESAQFERTVVWLLGLFGFSAIHLGEFEKLKAAGTEVDLGSIDILASRGAPADTLLLVSCTLGVPKEEDYRNLRNVQATLELRLLSGTTCRIIPVLFTATRGVDLGGSDELPISDVRVIDAQGLETMVASVESGEYRRFLDFLENPTFAPL